MERIFHATGVFRRTTKTGINRQINRRITCVYHREGARVMARIAVYNPNDATTSTTDGLPERTDGYPVKPRTLVFSRKRGVEAARASSRLVEIYLPTADLPLYAEKDAILHALTFVPAEILDIRGYSFMYGY